MDLEEEIEKINQNKSLKHIELDNEFNECKNLFEDKINDEQEDEEWIHVRKKFKKQRESLMISMSKTKIFIKNVYLEIKYKIDDITLIEKLFKELHLYIVIDYVKKWGMPLYINNFICKCSGIKSNYYKVLLFYLENQYVDFSFNIKIYSFSKIHKNIKIYINYDFKENKSNKIPINPLNIKNSPETEFNLWINKLTKNVNFDTGEVEYDNFSTDSTIYFHGNPHFILFTDENKSLEKYEDIFEEITFKFIVFNNEKLIDIGLDNICGSDFDIHKIINNFLITNKNEMINITIPKDRIIIRLFMNKTFFIVGLNDKFTGIKSIKQILRNKQYDNIYNYYNFITVIKDMKFFPSIFKKMNFYIF
jgi:hypothetical protein